MRNNRPLALTRWRAYETRRPTLTSQKWMILIPTRNFRASKPSNLLRRARQAKWSSQAASTEMGDCLCTLQAGPMVMLTLFRLLVSAENAKQFHNSEDKPAAITIPDQREL